MLAFARDTDGSLAEPTPYETRGRGSVAAHLPSQGSVVLSSDRRFLLVANAGSGEVSAFRVDGRGSSSWEPSPRAETRRAALPSAPARCS